MAVPGEAAPVGQVGARNPARRGRRGIVLAALVVAGAYVLAAAALWLYRGGYANLISVSGATGAEGFDEAATMAQYPVDYGVPQSAIAEDSSGVDTDATAAHACALMRERHLHTALVATQYFHVPRTELALGQDGVDVVGSRHARFTEWRDAYSLAREVIAVPAYLMPT